MVAALIPARAGSKRVPGKNTKVLAGHPLLAYSIQAAKDAGCFDEIWVSTDSKDVARVVWDYGAKVYLNDAQCHTDEAPDFRWIERILNTVPDMEAFAILRPTSPFRLGDSILDAWVALQMMDADSLRSVRLAREHPGKMWVERAGYLLPIVPWTAEQPWHSMPTQSLPPVYVQTSALEFAWTERTIKRGSISGTSVIPFLLTPPEDLAIDTPEDWAQAEALMAAGVSRPKPEILHVA